MNEKKIATDKFPMDGKWRVHWVHTEDGETHRDIDFTEATQINVVCNKFTFDGIIYNICLGMDENDGEHNNVVYFNWPTISDETQQVVESGLDLKRVPSGPDVNAVVVWTVNHPDFYRIYWVRL